MAYGTKYYSIIKNANSNDHYYVNIKKQNYVSGATQLEYYSYSPLQLTYKGGRSDIEDDEDEKVIWDSIVQLAFLKTKDVDIEDLLDADEKQFQVEIIKVNYTNSTYENLLISSAATNLNQLTGGTGVAWVQTGTSATVSLTNANAVSKAFYIDLDEPLTDFKFVIKDIKYTATSIPFVTFRTKDESNNVITSTQLSLQITTSAHDREFQYSAATPVSRIEFFVSCPVIVGQTANIEIETGIELYKGNNEKLWWRGFIEPSSISSRVNIDTHFFTIEATDYLIRLQDHSLPVDQETKNQTIISYIKDILDETDLDLEISDQLNLTEASASEPIFLNVFMDPRRFIDTDDGRAKNASCYDCLTEILKPFNCYIAQVEGKWTIISDEIASNVHTYDSSLNVTTEYVDREIEIAGEQFILKDSDELSKFASVKKLELTYQNRNLSDSLLANSDMSTTTGWFNTGSTAFDQFTAFSGRLLAGIVTNTNDPRYFRSSDFSFTILEVPHDTLRVTIEAELDLEFTEESEQFTLPGLYVELVGPNLSYDQEFTMVVGNRTYEWDFEVVESGTYYLKIGVIPDPSVTEYEYIDTYFNNITVKPVFSEQEITYDRFYLTFNANNQAVRKIERSIKFGDSENDGDIGQLRTSITGFTKSWTTVDGEVSNKSLVYVYSYKTLKQLNRPRNYIRVSLLADSTINFNSILTFPDEKKYRIIGYSYNVLNEILDLDLVEILEDEITINQSWYSLATVDGKGGSASGGGGSITIEGVSETEFNEHVQDNNSEFENINSRLNNLESVNPISVSNGLTLSNKRIRLGGTLTGNTTITTTSGAILNIAGYPIRYTTDLSSNFNARSLVDKAFVTGLTSSINSNIISIESDIDSIEDDLADVQTGLTSVESSISSIESDLGNVITGLTSINTNAVKHSNFSSNGILIRTSSSNYTSRSIAVGSTLSISNGNGVSGNPTISHAPGYTGYTTTEKSKLATIEANADVTDATNVASAGAIMDSDFSTNGLMIRTNAGSYTSRSITAANGITVNNGNGVSGNITVGINSTIYDAITGITANTLQSGTWTPSLSNLANITSSTAYLCEYTKIGNIVHISGKADITRTGATVAVLGVSLPISMNVYTGTNQAHGVGVVQDFNATAVCYANDSSTIAIRLPSIVSSQTVFFQATYRLS